GRGIRTAERARVGAQDADHFVVGITRARSAVVDLLHRRLRIAGEDVTDPGEHLLLADSGRQTNVGLEPARPGNHVHLLAAVDHTDVQGHALNDVLRAGSLRFVDRRGGAGERVGDVDGDGRV